MPFTATPPPAARATLLPDGAYAYSIRQGGGEVATSTITVSRRDDAIVISEAVVAKSATIAVTRTFDPLTFVMRRYHATTTALGGQQATADITLSGRHVDVSGGTEHYALTMSGDAPVLVGDNLATEFAILPELLDVTHANSVALAQVSGSVIALDMAIDRHPAQTRPKGVPSDDVALAETTAGVTAFVWYRVNDVVDDVEVPAQGASIVLIAENGHPIASAAPLATPVPLPPAHYTATDITFTSSDGTTLAGTITVPDRGTAPYPGVILVHGSGCSDRDETIGPNKIFAQLANALSNAGFAVLRWDKRGCAKSGGTFGTRDQLIMDATAALQFLRAQKTVDPKRTFAIGHSEGGELVPSLAVLDNALTAIVLMAPPALPLDRILLQQYTRGMSGQEYASAYAAEKSDLDAIKAGRLHDRWSLWLQSSLAVDPATTIARVPCPMLILQGEKDLQILPKDLPRLVAAARDAGRDVTVHTFPNDDHLFISLADGQPLDFREYWTPNALDPRMLEALTQWLADRSR